MTEAEWLECTDPLHLIDSILDGASPRKLRLLACACLIAVDRLNDVQRRIISVGERFADGDGETEVAALRSSTVFRNPRYQHLTLLLADDVSRTFRPVFSHEYMLARGTHAYCTIIRDIFGNPFRPVAFESAWLTETVLGLARGIYEDRAFERLSILADALQEAGCENEDILNHCREPGEHVRGCWVIDLVLGKT